MAIVPIEQLKTKFEGGDYPRSADYINLIDTLASLPEGGAAGETGPQGPQGIQGETGPQGPQGEPGASGGELGNISVSSNITLSNNNRYFVDTSAVRTLTLPAYPEINDEIQIIDSIGTSSQYNITIARNGNKINGQTDNLVIDTNGGWYTLVYTGATYGWKVG